MNPLRSLKLKEKIQEDLCMTQTVFRLVYVDFYTDEAEALANYYQKSLGYSLTEEKDGIYYLSSGYDHHNIVVTPSDKKTVKGYGYQWKPGVTEEEIQAYLKEHGYDSEILENEKPGLGRFVRLEDPAGNGLDLFTDMETTDAGFTGEGVDTFKLGHVAFIAKNFPETLKFYNEVLGFHNTDKIGEDFANFLTCNIDHHVINMISGERTALHHIAFELKDASHHITAADILAKQGIETLWGPSRHTAGSNIAAYHHDTDGNVVELYTDMDKYIPEMDMFEPRPWHAELPYKPKTWEGLSVWGTEFDFDLGQIQGVE